MEKITINNEKCLRCGMCTSNCSDVFEFNDNGDIEVKNENINEETKNDVKEAMDNCPVEAIEEN